MLARKYFRGTARRVASLAPNNFALALTLILVHGLAIHGCHSEKTSAGTSIKLTPIPPAAQVGRERVDTISTHLGFEHAALLVEPDHSPPPVMDTAPTQGGSVALVTIVKGAGTAQFNPTGSHKFSGYDWRVRMIASVKGGANNLCDPEMYGPTRAERCTCRSRRNRAGGRVQK